MLICFSQIVHELITILLCILSLDKVDEILETAETAAEVVEDLAELVERLADEAEKKLPDGTKLNDLAEAIENLAERVDEKAEQAQELIKEVTLVTVIICNTFKQKRLHLLHHNSHIGDLLPLPKLHKSIHTIQM